MNTNWAKILLFSLIGFAIGFLVCRVTCSSNCGGQASCAPASACSHSGEGKAACGKKGHGQGHGHHEDTNVHAIVDGLEAAGFQGDTTITIDGGTVNVKRTADQVEVKVEMREGEKHSETIEIEKTK